MPRSPGRKHSPVWQMVRRARAERRLAAPTAMQNRDDLGFIIKVTPAGVRLHDPGPIDRYLWIRATRKDG